MRKLGAIVVILALVAVAVWMLLPGSNTRRGGAKADARPPNVLFIVWDTVRADRMQLYGHDRANTPNLVRFAEQAHVFENAIAPAPWTVPSHASLFTGLSVTSHGANAKWRWLDHHHNTLAEVLGAYGYATYAYTANPYLSGLTNLLQGFEIRRYTWEDKKRAATAVRAKLIERDRSTEISPSFAGGPNVAWDNAPYKEAAELANDDLTTWLLTRKRKKRPWFAFVNLMEAHSPRIPRLETRERMMDADTLERGLATDVSLWREVSAMLGKDSYTEDELEAMRAVYDATIFEMDQAFGVLMDELEARGALDRTIVVLTSDHGESLGEHGLFEHRYGVYQTLVHVPLIIRYPNGIEPGRTKAPVSTASIPTTILELLGVDVPNHVSPSLADPRERPVFTQLTDPYVSKLGPFRKAYPDVDFRRFLRTFDAVIDGPLKLIEASDGTRELFDLHGDHAELHPLDSEPTSGLLASKLAAWRARVPKADPSKRIAADVRKWRGSKGEENAMQGMLEQLGYLEADE